MRTVHILEQCDCEEVQTYDTILHKEIFYHSDTFWGVISCTINQPKVLFEIDQHDQQTLKGKGMIC